MLRNLARQEFTVFMRCVEPQSLLAQTAFLCGRM
uniref:Uncharacterized protein n=1 Tax=Arundo donax TaxID=35708 RepID=A0A0A9FBV3_ARUDO